MTWRRGVRRIERTGEFGFRQCALGEDDCNQERRVVTHLARSERPLPGGEPTAQSDPKQKFTALAGPEPLRCLRSPNFVVPTLTVAP